MTCATTSNGTSAHSRPLTVEQASALIQTLREAQLTPGTNWYVVNQEWWSKFLELHEALKKYPTGDSLKLEPLSNEVLLQRDKAGNMVLKEGLVEDVNYKLVPEAVFNVIKTNFGVREESDVIKRPVVQGTCLQKDPFVEVYLLKLRVAKLSCRNDVKELQVSYADSFEELKRKAFDVLGVSEDKRSDAQIKFERARGDFETISEKLNSELDTILRMDMIFYVDDNSSTRLTRSMVANKPDDLNGNLTPSKRYSGYSPSSPTSELYPPGLCGLQNLGNTCFMNSALQCLSNVPELTEYFLSGKYLSEINLENVLGTHGKLVKAYGDLVRDMWSGKYSSIKPYHFKCVIGHHAPRFNGYAQQDSQELMSFLLDGLHEDLNRIYRKPYVEERESDGRPDQVVADEAWNDYKLRNDSAIVDLMHGQIKSTVVCPVCDKVSIKFDPIVYLTVPVPQKERQGKSTVVVIKPNDKWAKVGSTHCDKTLALQYTFSHTNKTSFGDMNAHIRNDLNVPANVRLVTATNGQTPVICTDESPLPVQTYSYSSYSSQRTFYTYFCRPGPLILVANQLIHGFNKQVTLPLLTNLDFTLTRKNVVEKLVPRVLEHFGRTSWPENSSGSSSSASDSPFVGQGVRAGGSQRMEEIHDNINAKLGAPPDLQGIFLEYDGNSTRFSDDPDEELKMPSGSGLVKIQLKWASTDLFMAITAHETLVEREKNLANTNRQGNHLNDCLDLFTVREQLDENDSWYCPKCKEHRRAYKKLDLWKLPQILIVHLKRFNYSRFSREKTDTEITIPVRNFCPTSINPNEPKAVYDLMAISNHMGGLGSGHYTAKAINKSTGRWADFNDSNASFCNELKDPFRSREAYWMVYRRRENSGELKFSPQKDQAQQRVQRPQRTKRLTDSEPMESD